MSKATSKRKIPGQQLFWNPFIGKMTPEPSNPIVARLTFGDCALEATEDDILIVNHKGKKTSLNLILERLDALETRYMEDTLLGVKDEDKDT